MARPPLAVSSAATSPGGSSMLCSSTDRRASSPGARKRGSRASATTSSRTVIGRAPAPMRVPSQATAISRSSPAKSGMSSGTMADAVGTRPHHAGEQRDEALRRLQCVGARHPRRRPGAAGRARLRRARSAGRNRRGYPRRADGATRKCAAGSGLAKLVRRRMPSSTAASVSSTGPLALVTRTGTSMRWRGRMQFGRVDRDTERARRRVDPDPGEPEPAAGLAVAGFAGAEDRHGHVGAGAPGRIDRHLDLGAGGRSPRSRAVRPGDRSARRPRRARRRAA